MRKIVFIWGIIIAILLTACSGKSEESDTNVDKEEKAPDSLFNISESIDELLSSMDSIEEILALSESEFQAINSDEDKSEDNSNESNQTGEENNKQQESSQNNQEENNSQNTQEDLKTRDEELFLKWQEVDKKIEQIHKSWNYYEVETLDKGISAEKSEELKSNLNALTVAVENRDIDSILDYGSKVFNSLASYFDLYKDEIGGDLSRIKYSVYQGFLLAEKGNIEEANKLMEEAEEHSARVRQRLDEDKVKDLEKLSLSISDMKQALENNSMELLKIKRDIVIDNIKSLQN